MTVILRPEDFEVVECVTHHYQEETEGRRPKWLWHCLTCDMGSNKYQRHPNGHRIEQDAITGATYHRNAKRMERQQECYSAWWWKQIMTTTDVEFFTKLWGNHHPAHRLQCLDMGGVMARVQADESLWDFAISRNPELKRPVRT